jgi:hypothetical protein
LSSADEGLVHQQHPRLVDDGAGERDALLLPAGELVGAALAVAAEAHRLQRGQRAPLALRPGDAAHLQREGDVLGHAHVREQRVALEHHAEIALVGGRPGDVLAADLDLARGRVLEPRDGHQDRRLARAAGAEQRHEFAGCHVERHPVHGRDRAETLHQVPDGHPSVGIRLPPPHPLLRLGVRSLPNRLRSI